jgi:hypothetical protein
MSRLRIRFLLLSTATLVAALLCAGPAAALD